MSDGFTPATGLFSAVVHRCQPVGTLLRWPDVLSVLATDGARERALRLYREAGFSPNDFERLRARAAMANALSRTEDWLELEGGHRRERAVIRDVRRRLEWEVWP
jgi:hypothetical protein